MGVISQFLPPIEAAQRMRSLDEDTREELIVGDPNVIDLRPRLANIALGLAYRQPSKPEK